MTQTFEILLISSIFCFSVIFLLRLRICFYTNQQYAICAELHKKGGEGSISAPQAIIKSEAESYL